MARQFHYGDLGNFIRNMYQNNLFIAWENPFFLFYIGKGVWLSWLKRCVHIAEIPGSNPGAPKFSPRSRTTARWNGVLQLLRKNFMRRIPLYSPALIVACLWIQVNASTVDTSCLSFESPAQGSIISTPSCTIAVRACGRVASMQFSAQYTLPDKSVDTTIRIGGMNSPPYKFAWNMESMPNIVYRGMTIYAQASLKSGAQLTVSRQGIFCINKPIFRTVSVIPYGKSDESLLFSQSLSGKRFPVTVHASGSWTDEALHFVIRVFTPIMLSTLSKELLAQMGIELCLDPALLRHPYPSDSTIVLTIPLAGAPWIEEHKPLWGADGSFDIAKNKIPASCTFDIRKEDMKGFAVTVEVPKELMAGSVPDSFGCNIIVKIPGDNNQIATLSWNNAVGANAYCPVLWATVQELPRPFFQNGIVQWLLSFVAGIFLVLASGLVYFMLKKNSSTLEKFEQSEDEKKIGEKVYRLIEEAVTKKDISLHWVGEKLDLQPPHVERLIRKHKGKSFRDYIMFLRIEIAKERLRSSHASEKSISESCGFKNVTEMEKYFSRYCRTTPYKFRKENQVA
jgi:AraC-like DNA-binding protein